MTVAPWLQSSVPLRLSPEEDRATKVSPRMREASGTNEAPGLFRVEQSQVAENEEKGCNADFNGRIHAFLRILDQHKKIEGC